MNDKDRFNDLKSFFFCLFFKKQSSFHFSEQSMSYVFFFLTKIFVRSKILSLFKKPMPISRYMYGEKELGEK